MVSHSRLHLHDDTIRCNITMGYRVCIYGGVLEMKAAYIMLFGYITMIGIPVLLMLSSFVSPFSSVQLLRYTMNILVSIGSIVYGIVAIRAIYLHSERRKR